MDPAEPFGSILFDRPSDSGERDDPSMFSDLNLDQVFAAVAAGRDEYEPMPFFRAPLSDVRAVEYRHQVQRDLEDLRSAGLAQLMMQAGMFVAAQNAGAMGMAGGMGSLVRVTPRSSWPAAALPGRKPAAHPARQ